MKKCVIFVLLALFLLSSPSLAHPGRTDSHGGHHDYENDSGLGPYHYHHGHPAHLHENGVCPYGDYEDENDLNSIKEEYGVNSGEYRDALEDYDNKDSGEYRDALEDYYNSLPEKERLEAEEAYREYLEEESSNEQYDYTIDDYNRAVDEEVEKESSEPAQGNKWFFMSKELIISILVVVAFIGFIWFITRKQKL